MEESHTSRTFCKKGVRKEFQSLEEEVWKWVTYESGKLGKLPNKVTIQKYAQEKYRKAGHTEFQASFGWYRRWKRRHKLKGNLSAVDSCSSSADIVQDPNLLAKTSISDASKNSIQQTALNTVGPCFSETLENFSLETDELMSNIGMVNSPSEFFDFSDNFEKSMDTIDVSDVLRNTESNDVCMKNFMEELMDDFGKYFVESDTEKSCRFIKMNKRSCKYDKDFKDKVMGFITEHRILEAATKFNISPNTISIWLKEYKFQERLTQIIIEDTTKKLSQHEIDVKEGQFIEWLREKDNNNVIVSKLDVKDKLSTLFMPSWAGKPHWFAKYCHKYLCGNQAKPTKINYSSHFQELVVSYATRTSQMKTAPVFNLSRKQLFNWMKNIHTESVHCKKQAEEELFQWYDSKSLKPAGKIVRLKAKEIFDKNTRVECSSSWYYKWCAKNNINVKRNCDEEIVEWILAAYDKNLNITHEDVQNKALEVYSSQKESNFKASGGWLLRFCRRYMNVLRRTPPLSSVLPSSCEFNVKKVREQLLKVLNENNINGDCFGVMDEILLKLKPSDPNNENNKKKPLLRSCGVNNIQGTVILSYLSNGTILPPVLILKDKNVSHNSDQVFITHQPNGTVDDRVMQFWLETVWFRQVSQPNVLIMDCFSPHVSEFVKSKFEEKSSHVVIIPAGCSSKLNPLAQVISPQFQESIDDNCRKWFEKNSLTWQIGGSGTSLSSHDIIDWVQIAYDSINNQSTQENVRNVFKGMELLVSRK